VKATDLDSGKEKKMFGRAVLCACAALVLVAPAASRAQEAGQGEGDPYVLAVMNDFNRTLRAEWMDLRVQVEQVELLTAGQERAGSHLHRQPFRWVSGDPRRASEGALLSYRVDLSDGPTPAGTEAAVDRAMATWSSDSCLKKMQVVKRPSDGTDADLFDAQFGYGGFGDYRAADVVHAGWLPPDFFEQVTGPGGGESVVALSATFIFVNLDGEPTDLDGDGYMDAAHSEIYYNRAFSWTTGAGDGRIDVESVALHEAGHALGIGHIDPRHTAVMNPVYAGPRTRLQSHDHAALCSIWAPWGK
jgi:Matrixin